MVSFFVQDLSVICSSVNVTTQCEDMASFFEVASFSAGVISLH